MSLSEAHNQDPYPKASAVIQQITKLTKRRKCIFRGESKLYDYPCSSGFYRELKGKGVTDGDMPVRLKEEQEKLIIKLRKERKGWKTDLERVMAHQHAKQKTNLLDFTGDLHIALFFACADDDDSAGQVIVKRKGAFHELDTDTPRLQTTKSSYYSPQNRSCQLGTSVQYSFTFLTVPCRLKQKRLFGLRVS